MTDFLKNIATEWTARKFPEKEIHIVLDKASRLINAIQALGYSIENTYAYRFGYGSHRGVIEVHMGGSYEPLEIFVGKLTAMDTARFMRGSREEEDRVKKVYEDILSKMKELNTPIIE